VQVFNYLEFNFGLAYKNVVFTFLSIRVRSDVGLPLITDNFWTKVEEIWSAVGVFLACFGSSELFGTELFVLSCWV